MIIGIDASRATPTQRTGTEAYARFLLQAIIPLALTAGHEIRLYFNQSPPPGLFPAQTGVVPVHIPLRRLWTHLRLGRELRHHPPDVFFTPAHVIPLAYRGPSVATVHDLGYHYFPRAHPRWQLAYLRWSTRHNAHRAGWSSPIRKQQRPTSCVFMASMPVKCASSIRGAIRDWHG